jgi:hypothetical protein
METYKVVFKDLKGVIGRIEVETDSFEDAILQVKEYLVSTERGYSGGVLALVPESNFEPEVDLVA